MTNINDVRENDVVAVDSGFEITIIEIDPETDICTCTMTDERQTFRVELPADVLYRPDDPIPSNVGGLID